MERPSHEIRRELVDGRTGHALTSSAEGGVTATFVPGAGMVCCSLRHRGQELLGQRGGLEHYVGAHSTMGIPLLYPWANRLARRRFRLGEAEVDLDRANQLVAEDPNGLPIHGLLAGHPGWQVTAEEADGDRARLRASFDFAQDARLLSAFPFEHGLEMEVTLTGATLRLLTTVHASGGAPVPISFGYHPYFTLPDVPRAEWMIDLPVSWHLEVDSLMLPTGDREPASGVEPGALGRRTFDDGYAEIPAGTRFSVAGGGRRIAVTFEQGYPVAVLYAPTDDEVICFEPMTAPTNALVSGQGLGWVAPGESWSSRFSVSVESA